MRKRPLLQQAAMIARLFRIDPVLVLTETDQIRYAARIAAAQYVIDTENEAHERAQRR